MVIPMLRILATWLVVLLVCGGIGLSLQRLFGRAELDGYSVIAGFWLGWSGLIAGLQLVHLFLPVGTVVRAASLAAGIGGLLWNRSTLLQFVRGRVSVAMWSLLALCAVSGWLANRAIGPLGPYDAGLYHLQAIRWASQYPIVAGLGNLHGRLAFNSSYFLYEALFDLGSPDRAIRHAASGPLVLMAAAQVALSSYRVFTRRHRCQVCDVFGMAFLAPVLHHCFTGASSTSPDLPAFLLGFVVGSRLCMMLFTHADSAQLGRDALVIVTVSAVGISIKASFLAYGCLAVVAALLRLGAVGAAGRAVVPIVRKCVRSAMLPLGVLVVWLVRGVILSGFPIYPSTALGVEVDWRVPHEQAAVEARWIRSWARRPEVHPDEVLSSWDWLGPWAVRIAALEVKGSTVNLFLPMLMGMLTVPLLAVRARVRGDARRHLLLLAPGAGSLAFWFVSAPEPRFAGAAAWSLAGGMLGAAVMASPGGGKWGHAALTCVMLATVALVAGAANHGLWVSAHPESGIHPTATADTGLFITTSGLAVYVPAEGDQCWEAPLPCAPYANPNLMLRQEGELGGGFLLSLH